MVLFWCYTNYHYNFRPRQFIILASHGFVVQSVNFGLTILDCWIPLVVLHLSSYSNIPHGFYHVWQARMLVVVISSNESIISTSFPWRFFPPLPLTCQTQTHLRTIPGQVSLSCQLHQFITKTIMIHVQ